MIQLNEKQCNIKKAREFCQKVKELANEYGLSFFVVTEGASAISNNGCGAVKNARDSHIKWELEHGSDPYEDWGKDKEVDPNKLFVKVCSFLKEIRASACTMPTNLVLLKIGEIYGIIRCVR